MNSYRVKIALQQLRPGMFVENVFSEQGIHLFCSNSLISNYHQIEVLRRQGVSSIEINAHKGLIPPGISIHKDRESIGGEEFADYQVQLKQMNSVRKNTIEAVKSLMLAAKAGRFFSFNTLNFSLQKMVDTITSVPDVAIGLCQIKSNSEFLYTHSVNVSVMMMGLAALLGYPKEKILDAGMAGMLHDIGALRLPESLLRKEGRLTYNELELYKKHTLFGVDIVKKYETELSAQVIRVILSHHERYNGGGFPHNLKGESIDDLVFLCAITDTFDRLTTGGLARKACLPQEALALVFQGSDEEYPRRLVEHFTKLLGIYPIGSLVKLESGEMGIVIKINRDKLLFPQVIILFDSNGKMLDKPIFRDLSSAIKEKDRDMWRVMSSLNPQIYNIQPSDIIFSYAV